MCGQSGKAGGADKAFSLGAHEPPGISVMEDEEDGGGVGTGLGAPVAPMPAGAEAQEAFQPGSTTRPTYSASMTQRYLMTWNRTGVVVLWWCVVGCMVALDDSTARLRTSVPCWFGHVSALIRLAR